MPHFALSAYRYTDRAACSLFMLGMLVGLWCLSPGAPRAVTSRQSASLAPRVRPSPAPGNPP